MGGKKKKTLKHFPEFLVRSNKAGGRRTDGKSPNSLHCTTGAADFEAGMRGGVFGCGT